MFGFFGISKDANKSHGFILNFVDFAKNTIGLFGIKKGMAVLSQAEWAAGSNIRSERGCDYLTFRLAIPFSSFYASIDNDTLGGQPSQTDVNIRIEGIDAFQGFGLIAYTERELIQVYALNRPDAKATARAAMLMARFKSKGATDISSVLKGMW
jgi:hypothetical protein